jgi:hypothetical protein
MSEMSFLKFLHGIGDRLGILEAVSNKESAPAVRIQTRTLTLKELSSEIRSGEVKTLAYSIGDLTFDFDRIFESAGIAGDPKCCLEKLNELVCRESAGGRPKEEVQKSILAALAIEGVSVEELVKNAMARDKALDSFETFAGEKIKGRRSEIESQIDTLQQQLRNEQGRWTEWRKSKRAHERDLATILSYVVDHPVISTDDTDD